MKEDSLLRQARLAGMCDPEEGTFGEVVEFLELWEERERRQLQLFSLVAYRHALLLARVLSGGTASPVEEAFPFWSEEEVGQAKLDRCRRLMERLASAREEENERKIQ